MPFIDPDLSSSFVVAETIDGLPKGMGARIIRLAPALDFDAIIRLPAVMAMGEPDAVISCDHAVLHRSFTDLPSAHDWILSWAARFPATVDM